MYWTVELIFMLLCYLLGGESGVPLKLQFEIQDTKSQTVVPLYCAGCQIKVFRVGLSVYQRYILSEFCIMQACTVFYLLFCSLMSISGHFSKRSS